MPVIITNVSEMVAELAAEQTAQIDHLQAVLDQAIRFNNLFQDSRRDQHPSVCGRCRGGVQQQQAEVRDVVHGAEQQAGPFGQAGAGFAHGGVLQEGERL